MRIKDTDVYVLESWETRDGVGSETWRKASPLRRLRCFAEWLAEFARYALSLGRDHGCAVHHCGPKFWLWYPTWLSCEFDRGSGDKCQGCEFSDYLDVCREIGRTVVMSNHGRYTILG